MWGYPSPVRRASLEVFVADFADEIKRLSGVDVRACFQCRKCSNGCPVAEFMDAPPAKMIRSILHGRREEALKSKTIWICASCYTCSTRCPNNIDFARVADALRALALEEKRPAALPKVATFHREFLKDVARRGRIHESILMPMFKLAAMDLTSDMELGLAMFLKGKLPMIPHGVKDKKAIKAAFALGAKPAGKEKP
jgi:heterodisulfide reductase subunit C2